MMISIKLQSGNESVKHMANATYRWVIVAAGGFLGCIAIGTMFALPIFITPMVDATGWSRTGISSAMTIGFLAMAIGSFMSGALADRYGPKRVVLAGSVMLAMALALASQATALLVFQLLFGLGVGGAASAIMAPLMAAVAGWFETQRSLAISLVSAGFGLAPATMSPLAAWLVWRYDWRVSMLILSAIVVCTMIPLSCLIRRPPALEAQATGAPAPAHERQMSLKAALLSPPFLILALTNFFCCSTHSGPIFHTVSYAISCGIPLVAASSIYAVEGIAGMAGRIGFGLVADRLGAKTVLATGLLAQAVFALAYAFVNQLPGFYTVAALFGFTYAGVMPLYSVLARENFPLSMMGTIIGGTAMAGSLGMATGPLAGGLIYDHFASYAWLYIGAAGMGLGAFLAAMSFRPHDQKVLAAE
jgi:MFS family permease